MANLIQTNAGTPIVWADTTDYGGDGGSRTDQIDLTSLANGAARQGVKKDLGDPRARQYAVTLRLEYDVAPGANVFAYLYWAPSLSVTDGTANPAAISGVDGAYTGTAGATLAQSLPQLMLIGVMQLTLDADTIIQQETWMFTPPTQYGSPVVYNAGGQALEGDAEEMSITFTPEDDEAQ